MAIRFRCSCGRLLQAANASAGMRMKCPACGEMLTVPRAAPPGPQAPLPGGAGPRPGSPPPGAPTGFLGSGPSVDAQPFRGTRRMERDRAIAEFSSGAAFLRAFVYPFTGSGKWMIFLVPIAIVGVSFVPCVGWFLAIGVYFGWIIQVIQGATFGPEGELVWGDFSFWGERVWPGLKIIGNAIVVLVLPIIITGQLLKGGILDEDAGVFTILTSSGTLLGLWVAVALYYVMSFTIVATYGEFLASLNPVIVIRSILRIPGEYVLVWLFCVGLYFLSYFALLPLTSVSPIAAKIVSPFFNLYVTCVIVSRLGLMAYRNREELGWG